MYKCHNCVFYFPKLHTCMFCDYINVDEFKEENLLDEVRKRVHDDKSVDIPKCEEQDKDEFDILKLDDEECEEWSHKKILKRLHNNGIECFFVDIWGCDELAYITGINCSVDTIDKVARVLGIHRECIYCDWEHSFMILNLFQEKILRERE